MSDTSMGDATMDELGAPATEPHTMRRSVKKDSILTRLGVWLYLKFYLLLQWTGQTLRDLTFGRLPTPRSVRLQTARIDGKKRRLQELALRNPSLAFAALNGKGSAGKTPINSHLATILRWVTHKAVMLACTNGASVGDSEQAMGVYDANSVVPTAWLDNLSAEQRGKMIGVPTKTVRDMHELMQSVDNPSHISNSQYFTYAVPNWQDVHVLASYSVRQSEDDASQLAHVLKTVLDEARRRVAFVVTDPGNDSISARAKTEFEALDELAFVARPEPAASLSGLHATMEQVRLAGGEDFRQKVARSRIVITGFKPGLHDWDDIKAKYMGGLADKEPFFVPYDPEIEKIIVNPEKLQQATLEALLDILIDIFESADSRRLKRPHPNAAVLQQQPAAVSMQPSAVKPTWLR